MPADEDFPSTTSGYASAEPSTRGAVAKDVHGSGGFGKSHTPYPPLPIPMAVGSGYTHNPLVCG